MKNIFFIFMAFNGCFLSLVHGQHSLEAGEGYLENGKFPQAKAFFAAKKNCQKSLEYLGDIASFEKDWNAAVGYYEGLVKAEPENAGYNFKYGGALGMKAMSVSRLQALGLVGTIKAHLDKAAKVDKEHAEVRRALVEFYIQIPSIIGGDKKLSEGFAQELSSISKLDALVAKAYIYRHSSEKALARETSGEAIRAAWENEKLITRNYLFYELGHAAAEYDFFPEEGLCFLKKYLANYGYQDLKIPAWAYFRMAQIEINRKNKLEALAYLEKSLNEEPDFKEAKIEMKRINAM